MARRHYMISYDIADDKRRYHVFRLLHDYGDRAQYSVFFCELSARELAALRGRLDRLVNHRQDQVIILALRPASDSLANSLTTVGKAYEPPVRVTVV